MSENKDMQLTTTSATGTDMVASAIQAQAIAAVQARCTMAIARPRNIDDARVRLLKECKRSSFAEQAQWRRPVGGQTITGPSIRFVEAAVQALGNIYIESPCIYDGPDKRIVRVQVTDLESNATYCKDLTISKTVERKSLKSGQLPLGERVNSYGKTVYLVEATDDELNVKEAAQVSKAVRVLAQRLIPGWLVEEAMERCEATLASRGQQDPDAERKRLVDAFAGIGVKPAQLVGWLSHDLDAVTPAEITELRAMFTAIKAGEARWSDFEVVDADYDEPEEPKKSKSQRTADALKARKGKDEPGADG